MKAEIVSVASNPKVVPWSQSKYVEEDEKAPDMMISMRSDDDHSNHNDDTMR